MPETLPASSSRARAFAALLLISPAATLGVLFGMILWPGPVGQALFIICKVWMAILPVVWWLYVDRGRWSWSPVRKGGLGVGAALGVLIAGAIFGGWFLLGDVFVPTEARELMRNAARENGLAKPAVYIAGCVYWITVNSLMEEYVYRWFIVTKLEQAFTSKSVPRGARTAIAVFGSALIFTVHHVFAMRAQGLGWAVTAISNAGIFVGGAIWSWLYARYESVWPCYLSHAIVDLPIFVIGWWLIFG